MNYNGYKLIEEEYKMPEKDFVIENGILKDYTGWEDDVVIPDGVKRIDDYAFGVLGWGEGSSLRSVVIPDGAEEIGACVFEGRSELTSVTIPDSITKIERRVFKDCRRLTAIKLPDGMTSISSYLFENCRSLASVNIPENTVKIGDGAFKNCEKIASINIPDSVTQIGESAFQGLRSITSIIIPSKLKKINNYVFKECGNLTSVIIPEGVKTIGKHAFLNCVNLKSVTLPKSITGIDNSFTGCGKLNKIILPDGIKSFKKTALEVFWESFSKGEHKNAVILAFFRQYPQIAMANQTIVSKLKANKNELVSLAIKEDVVAVFEAVFALQKKVPINEIDRYLNQSADALDITAFLLEYKAQNYSSESQEKYESDKIEKEIGLKEKTLAEWKQIYQIEVADNTVTIKGYKGDETDIVVPDRMGKYKVTAIGDYAFCPYAPRVRASITEYRENIESITIPDGVECIGDMSFACCYKLKKVTIPKSVTEIDADAFKAITPVIAGYRNTCAQEYARKRRIKFEAIE